MDPDLWLYVRLTIGRGWRLAITLAAWCALFVLLSTQELFLLPLLSGAGGVSERGLFEVALFVLVVAPAQSVARLIDAEHGGLLDQTRLCGRPPRRVLLAFLLGATGPLVIVAALLLGNHVRFGGDPGSVLLAVLVFGAALAVSLLVYGTLPPAMTPDSRFLLPLLFVFSAAGFYLLRVVPWMRDLAFTEPAALTALGAVAVALPVGGRLASRRLMRAPQPAWREGTRWPQALSRLVPRWGPPEFNRQFRCTLLSGGTLATMVAAPLLVVIAAGQGSGAVAAIPLVVVLVGFYSTSMTVRRELQSSTIDFVRLTPQSPEAIAVSWYAGLALPYWIAALLAAVAAEIVAPGAAVLTWPALALLAILPAFSLAEGFQRRKPATYLWLPASVAAWMAVVDLILRGRLEPLRTQAVMAVVSWTVDLPIVIVACAVALAIGSASGRVRRPDGPALAGAAAAAGVCAVAVSTLALPASEVARFFPALLVLLASFAAEERVPPTSPWSRLALVGIAAFASATFVTWEPGAASGISSLTNGAGAALAAGIGVLLHELCWRMPALSFGLRFLAVLGLLGVPRLAWGSLPPSPPFLPEADVPALARLHAGEVLALAGTFAVVAAVHAVVRARANVAATSSRRPA